MKPEITRDRGWSFATIPASHGGGYVGWAKMGEILGTNPVNEPGQHVWFNRAETREAVVQKLKSELGLVRA
jgi:hypothetical protein